jgi:Rrf2 family iron-sulfur cluster assembly transcriptional regulator
MLSTTAQYALRALTRLAQEPDGSDVLGRTLAEDAEIPANYLSKLLVTLRNAGIVEATRGAGGGYRMLRSAADVKLIEIVEIFDAPRAKPSCFLGHKECSDAEACVAHEAWKKIRNQFLDFLESTSLADISANPGSRTNLVNLPPVPLGGSES